MSLTFFHRAAYFIHQFNPKIIRKPNDLENQMKLEL